MAEIKSIKKVGHGHFEIIVEQNNYKRKYPFGLSSVTTWKYTTNLTYLIDDYKDDDWYKSRMAKIKIIRLVKENGMKNLVVSK